MTFDSVVKMLKIRVTKNQRLMAHKLERKGKRFCIDFGLCDLKDRRKRKDKP